VGRHLVDRLIRDGWAVLVLDDLSTGRTDYLPDTARLETFADGVMGPLLLNRRAAAYLRDEAYSCVLWNAVGGEWVDPEDWVERVVKICLQRPWTLLVLHDLPTGAMKHLPRFLDRVPKEGARFRQDFPADCVPIKGGQVTGRLSPYVAGGWDDMEAA
jgi:hypothetical protein